MDSFIFGSDPFGVADFVINQRNGIKGLVDEMSPKTVPSEYIQPPEERFHDGKISPDHQNPVPVIDVSDWTDVKTAADIFKAACQWGVFQIVNHGIPMDVLLGMKQAARRFFELPVEQKKLYWREMSVSETAVLTTSFGPFEEGVLEWRDFIKFRFVTDKDDFAAKWPSICRDEVIDYFKRTKPVIKKIMQILMRNLNVDVEGSKENGLMGNFKMNFNYYPECPDPELVVGCGRHSDINTLTLLLQDEIGGLYVRHPDDTDEWIPVSSIEGALVVNIGDVLQIISNDRYKSVEHRAAVNKDHSRVSVPIFCSPVDDAVISPLLGILEEGEKPLYKKFVYSDYFKHFFAKVHDGKTNLEFVRI